MATAQELGQLKPGDRVISVSADKRGGRVSYKSITDRPRGSIINARVYEALTPKTRSPQEDRIPPLLVVATTNEQDDPGIVVLVDPKSPNFVGGEDDAVCQALRVQGIEVHTAEQNGVETTELTIRGKKLSATRRLAYV